MTGARNRDKQEDRSESRRARGFLLFAGLLAFLVASAAQPAYSQAGDASYGRDMLEARRCTFCHPIAGEGGGDAPDLGRQPDANFSPAMFAATMWNHGPKMWEQMEEKGMGIPFLTQVELANLYAYFYSLRYFDPPSDVERGQQVFGSMQCASCHAMQPGSTDPPPGPPVSRWLTVADPVYWMQQMWNHGAQMAAQLEAQRIDWPQFSLQEMVDLLGYLETVPELQLVNPGFRLGDWTHGEALFSELECAECHTLGDGASGKVDLLALAESEPRLSGLAVEMWNHRPRMQAAAEERGIELAVLEGDQMADLLAFLFRRGYFDIRGEADRGQHVFEEKHCGACHGQEDSEAPRLRGTSRDFTVMGIATSVWTQGPMMDAHMKALDQAWPELSGNDIADLVAFLNR